MFFAAYRCRDRPGACAGSCRSAGHHSVWTGSQSSDDEIDHDDTEPTPLANSARRYILHRAGSDVEIVPLTSAVTAEAWLTASMQ